MARDLSTRELRGRSLPQKTFRRETTMPRQATERPEREVNARILRPDMSGAEELSRLLGMVNDTAQTVLKDRQDAADKRDAADALMDFQSGQKDDGRFKKSRTYRDIYQREGAKKLSLDIANEVTEAVNTRLNDDNDPATIDDINDLIEEVYRKHLYDEQGNLLDFGTPEAKTILGNALGEVKAKLIPQAIEAIKKQTDEKVLGTIAYNFMAEHDRGAPIGVPASAEPVDPLAPLPDGQDAPRRAPRVSLGAPTGKLPVQGAITSTLAQHRARGSAGLDIDAQMGDPVVAPAGGKVKVGRDAKSGLFVKIDHGNGVVSSYAHLSSTDLKTGDIVRSGQRFAAVGNSGHVSHRTGDGSHLHYRIKVNGKDVDPQSYRFADNSDATDLVGQGPELASNEAPPQRLSQPVRFEDLMSRIPPTVDKADAKKYFLQSIINEANRRNDPSLLAGLEDSLREDRTPSFNPSEIASIISAREQIGNRARADAERAEREFHDANQDKILEAMLSDNPPSAEFIAQAGKDGKIDDQWAYSMVNHLETEAKQEAREARAEERQAQAEEDAEIDVEVSSMIAARMSGDLTGASAAADKRLFDTGALGTGKKAIARLRSLGTARRQGEQVIRQNPQVAVYAARIKMDFAGSTGSSLLERRMGGGQQADKVSQAGALSLYNDKIRSGIPPEQAYREAKAAYTPKQTADRRTTLEKRRQALLLKQQSGR